MTKKVFHIFISFVILVMSSGFTIQQHYCGNKLISASVFHAPESCCKGPCKCCHNKSLRVQIKDHFVPVYFNAGLVVAFDWINIYYCQHLVYYFHNSALFSTPGVPGPSPPLITSLQIFLKTFRL